MKTKMKKCTKVLLAVLLTLAVVLQPFVKMEFGSKAADTEYKEMKFDDWSVFAGQSWIYDTYSLMDASKVADLNGVAISGNVNFSRASGTTRACISIGGTVDVKHGGFWLYSDGPNLGLSPQGIGGTGTDHVVLAGEQWEALKVADFALRVTFDKDASTGVWLVGVYINNDFIGKYDCGAVSPGLYMGYSNATMTNTEKKYAEMKFGDWGMPEGTVGYMGYSLDLYSLTDTSIITSLDGVAVSGKINFNSTVKNWITLGGTSDVKHGGFWLGAVQENGWAMACQGIGTGYGDTIKWSESAKFNEEVLLRITFDKATDNDTWTVKVYADGTEVGTWEYSGITPGLYIGFPQGMTVDRTPTVPVPVMPDIYNPPTEMGGESLVGKYITYVDTAGTTTVISVADTDNSYKTGTSYDQYGLDYVMDFNVDRELKILQLTDTQIIDSAQCRTASRLWPTEKESWKPDQMYNNLFRYIIKTVHEAKPDLILITGDIIYGEFDDDGTSLLALIKCMDSLRIPWAPIFGNHENESDMGVRWQCEQLENSPYCLFNRRNEIGGNGNYSIGIAKNGNLERVIYMLDSNGCANNSEFNGDEVKMIAGFTSGQKKWYQGIARHINQTAGKMIPSFLAYHIPTKDMGKAAVAAGYQTTVDSMDTYTLGVEIPGDRVQPGDSGTKGEKGDWSFEDSELLALMKEVGTDGAFFGHVHLNSLSIMYEGIRWTYGLKTGTYDSHPDNVGGTLITLATDMKDFSVTQIQTKKSEIDRIYPKQDYVLPEKPEKPNKVNKPDGTGPYKELSFSDFGMYNGLIEGTDVYSLKEYNDITSLDGVAISGKVNFNGAANAKIRFGGTEELKHAGFWLFDDGANIRLSPQGIGADTVDHYVLQESAWMPLRSKEIDLRVTFDRDKATGIWFVGVYVNGEQTGIFNCRMVTPGMYLGIDPTITVEGLGDTVKKKGLDFTLFGYSNENWRKEMELE